MDLQDILYKNKTGIFITLHTLQLMKSPYVFLNLYEKKFFLYKKYSKQPTDMT